MLMHTVAIVDDHPAIRLAVRTVLEGSGRFKIVGEAATGPDALSLAREQRPSLLLLDLDLPGLSGLDLIERLKESCPGIKLLVLSAQPEQIFANRVRQAGADGFVSKAGDLQALIHAALSILAGFSMFPSSATASRIQTSGVRQEDLVKMLSDRELAVVQHLARGLTNMEIANLMLISNKTVSSYKTRIFEKLSISTVVELADFARANKLIT